ncbi:MAG TPA: Ig-like domain-containing protein [Terracidiphilus sp.]|nr:Ig-like domain-containing protein [Terracidiphilus sp.]
MRSILTFACLTALSSGIALAQSPVAYVYVAEDFASSPTNSPITAYAASSNGQLTQIPGSPFTQTSGMMAGDNGSHFITVDQNSTTTHQYLHVYNVAPNGAIGSQLSTQDLHEWCGMDWGAELDHTGQFVYVMDDLSCGESYQSFALSKSGQLSFVGTLPLQNQDGELPVFSGNDQFAYTFTPAPGSSAPCPTDTFLGMNRESSGALNNAGITVTGPTPPTGQQAYQAAQMLVTDDPTNHLASYVVFSDQSCGGTGGGLASYTVESNGDLVSTNTYQNLAQTAGYLSGVMKLNPAGNVLAVGVGSGVQFFHFNGANPITTFTGVIGATGYIYSMAWDDQNHLYALNGKTGKLHVYTVTTTSVVEAPGSPYLPPNSCTSGGCSPQSLIVRSVPTSMCSAPSTGGINVCTPAENASVTSPLPVNAAASISGGIYRFSLWNGNTKLLNEDTGTMQGSVSLSPGIYHLIFDASNTAGVHEYAKRDITVTGSGACTAPTSNGINVCSPAENATVSSPVAINAAAYISGGIYRFELWNGNTKLLTEDNGTMDSSVSLAAGTYKLTFDVRNAAGNHYYATRDITVK